MRRLGLGLLVLACALPAAGLDPRRALTQYVRDTWQTAEGLPQNSVAAILRTHDGYLWLGTEQGLARFDGVRFVVFDRTNSPGLPHDAISALLEDRAGRLWIGTSRGLARRDGASIVAIRSEEELRVATLAETHDGRILVGTLGHGLQTVEGDRLVPAPEDTALAGRRVRTLRVAADGAVWVATEKGVARLQGREVHLLRKGDGLLDENTFDVWVDADGTLWIGGDSGVQSYKDGRFRAFSTPEGLASPRVRVLWRDSGGSLWIGTQDGGVARLTGDGRIDVLNGARGLSSDGVEALYEDSEGSLWLGTRAGGLVRLREGRIATLGPDEGLPDELVHSIFEDRAGTLWFGMRSGGLMALAGTARRVYGPKDGLPGGGIASLAEDAEGRLWAGSYGGGLARLDGARFTQPLSLERLGDDTIQALLLGRDGSLLIGTASAGVKRLRAGALTAIPGLPAGRVQALLEDRSGALWIGTDEGLLQVAGGSVRSYARSEGLSDKSVLALHEDRSGVLWVGTAGGGVDRFKDGRFAAVTKREGLADDLIGRILEDAHEFFWMSGDHGLTRVARRALEDVMDGRSARVSPELFGTGDGMRSAEGVAGSQPAGWKARDGRLWFPTIRGAVVVDPEHLATNPIPPPVLVEEARLDGRVVDPAGTLVIPAGAHSLELQYTGLSLLDPTRVRFRYRLAGYDTGWTEAGTRRTAYYTGLAHGSYRFQVIACNNDGVWNDTGAAFAFRVAPHWYETQWFRFAAVLAAILLLFSGYRLRVLRFEARQRELQALVDARTRALHEANQALERLASLDGLTQIANRRVFDAALEAAWADHRRRRASIALVMCDVDHFKPYNDRYGHPEGDHVLVAVAQALARVLHRETDLVARYGGEEFALLLRDTDLAGARRIALEAREAVKALALPHAASSTAAVVTLSLGVSVTIPGPGAAQELVTAADVALYAAKTEGRDRVAG